VLGRTGRSRTSDRDVLEGIAFVLSNVLGRAAARKAGQRCRVALAGDEGDHHGPPVDPERVPDHDRELDQRVPE
jgi:hypothetical protein